MKKYLMGLLGACMITLGSLSTAISDTTFVAEPEKSAAQKLNLAGESPNKVEGLELPANFTVTSNDQFVTVKAECKGAVDWIVVTNSVKVKYKIYEENKEIVIGIPSKSGVITVFCYGLVDNKLTRPVRCDITVTDGINPTPKPDPEPDPIPVVKGPFTITIIEDPLRRTADYTVITHWIDTKTQLISLGHKAFLLSHEDPQIKNPANGFADLVKQYKLPILAIQDKDGKLVGAGPAPKTVDDLKRMITKGK